MLRTLFIPEIYLRFIVTGVFISRNRKPGEFLPDESHRGSVPLAPVGEYR